MAIPTHPLPTQFNIVHLSIIADYTAMSACNERIMERMCFIVAIYMYMMVH